MRLRAMCTRAMGVASWGDGGAGLSGEGVRSGVLAWYGEKMVEARGGRQ